MTVSTEIIMHSYYPGDAMAEELIPFQFLDADHVTANVVGNANPLVAGTDYVITGDGRARTAKIRTLRAFPADEEVRLLRITAMRQDAITDPFKPLPAEQVGRELDRRALIEQELGGEVSRSFRVPLGESGGLLPPSSSRAGKFLVGAVDGSIGVASGTGNDPALRNDLAVPEMGAGLVAISHDADYPTGSIGFKEQTYVSPYDHPFNATGGPNDTAAVQAAVTYCILNYPHVALDWSGEFNVSSIVMEGGNGLLVVGVCRLTANSPLAQASLLDIKMPGVIIDGALKLNVGYRHNYECGMWLHATAAVTVQFSFPADVVVNGAKIGFRVGDKDYPSGLTSEITLTGISTYGCPVCVEAIGAETYVTIDSPQLSADAFGGDAEWQALPKRVIRSIGADVVVTGGSTPLTSVSTGAMVELQPIFRTVAGNYDGFYGSVTLIGVRAETASPYLLVTNPDGLVIDPLFNRRGLFAMIGCRGYHGNDSAPSMSTPGDFDGDIILKENRLWSPVNRSQFNVQAGSVDTHVYIDDMGMGHGFMLPLAGVSGGTVHHGMRTILQMQDPLGQALALGDNTLIFHQPNGVDTFRGEFNYSAAGVWRAEQQFANLRIRAQVGFAAALTGRIKIIFGDGSSPENLTEVWSEPFNTATGVSIEWATSNFLEHQSLRVWVELTGTAGAVNASGFLSTLTIEARN